VRAAAAARPGTGVAWTERSSNALSVRIPGSDQFALDEPHGIVHAPLGAFRSIGFDVGSQQGRLQQCFQAFEYPPLKRWNFFTGTRVAGTDVAHEFGGRRILAVECAEQRPLEQVIGPWGKIIDRTNTNPNAAARLPTSPVARAFMATCHIAASDRPSGMTTQDRQAAWLSRSAPAARHWLALRHDSWPTSYRRERWIEIRELT